MVEDQIAWEWKISLSPTNCSVYIFIAIILIFYLAYFLY